MTVLETDLEQLLGLVPGARIIDDFAVPDDLDAEFELPYGDNPPLEWFTTVHHDVVPGASGLITADGRFCAYSHEWDRCHNGYTSSGECWTPPRSATGNKYFQQSSLVTAEGVQIDVGVIPLGEGHAPVDVDIWQAMAHYDRPERVRVRARAVETDHGCVMCGALVPGTTHRQVGVMRAAALSGDWRWVPELGVMEFLGPCFVARPGLPLGLEHAALAALWDIGKQMVVELNNEQVVAAVSVPVSWSPRSPVVDNVPAPVIAAAQQGAHMSTVSPHQVLPAAAGGIVTPQAPVSAGAACSCGGHAAPDPVTAAAPVAPAGVAPRRARATRDPRKAELAAAGTPFSYRELDDEVRSAVSAEFGRGESVWAWVKDWDDQWVVFELEFDDPIEGFVTKDFMVSMAIDATGVIVLDRGSLIEVTTTFVPAPGAEVPVAAQPDPAAEAPVAAHASDTAAIAAIAGQVSELSETVASVAADVGRMQAEQLPAAEVTEALPEPPEIG